MNTIELCILEVTRRRFPRQRYRADSTKSWRREKGIDESHDVPPATENNRRILPRGSPCGKCLRKSIAINRNNGGCQEIGGNVPELVAVSQKEESPENNSGATFTRTVEGKGDVCSLPPPPDFRAR